jgi:DNA-binding MurR/RpiR family transcriptional regulator
MNEVPLRVVERLRRVRNELAPAEQRVVEALLVDYPMAGLGSVAELAARAGVSAPTVLRLLGKLGFSGYPEFREQLRGEVAARLFSSAAVYPAAEAERPLARAESAYTDAVRETFHGLHDADVERAVEGIADPAVRVLCAGGRFSATLATHLAWYLQTLRPGVEEVPPGSGYRARSLLSVDERSVLVVFDFRPAQSETVEFATVAAERGARVLLVCDRTLSPIAPEADVVLPVAVGGPPPFDSMVGGLMVVETLVAAVAARLGDTARQRLGEFEAQVGASGVQTRFTLGNGEATVTV